MNPVPRINRVAVLLTVLLLPPLLIAGVETQGDWSGASGVTGPVTFWWQSYSSQSQTTGISVPPGKLYLGVSTISHAINSSMGGCHYAFPADMDGDGDVDVLAQSTHNWDVAWFENDGNGGGWNTHMVSDNYPVPRCAYPDDLDCDGDMDVAGANGTCGTEW